MLVGYVSDDEVDGDKKFTDHEITKKIMSKMQSVVTAPDVGNIEL